MASESSSVQQPAMEYRSDSCGRHSSARRERRVRLEARVPSELHATMLDRPCNRTITAATGNARPWRQQHTMHCSPRGPQAADWPPK
jgi:hypothetical protein